MGSCSCDMSYAGAYGYGGAAGAYSIPAGYGYAGAYSHSCHGVRGTYAAEHVKAHREAEATAIKEYEASLKAQMEAEEKAAKEAHEVFHAAQKGTYQAKLGYRPRDFCFPLEHQFGKSHYPRTGSGFGHKFYKNGNTYYGNFTDGQPDGLGVATNSNGDTYDGRWSEGKRQGKGVEKNVAGHTYDGEWQGNSRCGQGTMLYKDGVTYTGPWVDNEMEGEHGKMSLPNGDTYEGPWAADSQNGQGVHTRSSDGAVFSGPFKDGVRCGSGVVKLQDGTEYHSTWHGNAEQQGSGLGVYTNPDWEAPLRPIDLLLARPAAACHPYAKQALNDTLNRDRFSTSSEVPAPQ